VATGTHEPPAGTGVAVSQIALPPAARALSTFSRIDYEDAFFVDADPGRDRTAEQWARAVLEDAPLIVRRRLRRGWRALGLKLGSGSRIGMPGGLLFKRERHGLLFATFVQQKNPVVRAVWARIAPRHQRVVRSLLTQAAARVRP
jgi:hypothetical protein